jgi:hypothetical protein
MSDPIVIPLKVAGDSLTMAVTHCAPSTRGKYPGVEFIGTDGPREVMVEMPKVSADRQLGRLSLSMQTVVGKIITISRGANADDATKPYWNVAVVGNGAPPKTNGAASVQQPEPPPPDDEPEEATSRSAKLRAVFALQEVCFTHALKLAEIALQAGVPANLEGVSALTAQALIEACRRGIA